MPSTQVSLRQLLTLKGGLFYVPTYQRRYVWGQPRAGRAADSASFLTECISKALAKKEEMFLNSITLCSRPGREGLEIVDGQQRLTYLRILLAYLQSKGIDTPSFKIRYDHRSLAQEWMTNSEKGFIGTKEDARSQDEFFFCHTLECIQKTWPNPSVQFADAILDSISLMCIELDDADYAIPTFRMMNGTKTQMAAADIIKADLMRRCCEIDDPEAEPMEIFALRSRLATEWEDWARWWNREDVHEYYGETLLEGEPPLSLLLKLTLRETDLNLSSPLNFEEFRVKMNSGPGSKSSIARSFFNRVRHTQKRFEDAFNMPQRYNWLKAIMLLQNPEERALLLHHFFVEGNIGDKELKRFYKLSFLGMTFSEIRSGMSEGPKFDELMAAISMADVYHTEAKRDAFFLLLRLNIDEDVKLGRKFDFSVWNNRSLEHIYSKSKVWHLDEKGHTLDGNDNPLHASPSALKSDSSFMHRDSIVNLDGVQLTEHCIGNLVLLYGQNNSEFGNSNFEQKKAMFLSPGTQGAFRSRNLLHSVCVFACNSWNAQSIIDNYNLILNNLETYYGYQ